MWNRDIAVIAFKTLSLWVIVTGLFAAVEVFINWEQSLGHMKVAIGDHVSAPPETLLGWSIVAFLVRSLLGVGLWAVSGPLARWVFPSDAVPSPPEVSRTDLFNVASFLVGLWLLADTVPALAYVVRAVQLSDMQDPAWFVEYGLKLALGVALLKAGWLARLIVGGEPREEESESGDGG